MKFLSITKDYFDPESLPNEVVERKGIGHPDSLADALANEISIEFSNHCIERFGCVLHHNLDKLYIGGGHFKNGYGFFDKISPIKIQVNGRISNSFGDIPIDVEKIQKTTVSRYLLKVLPNISTNDFEVIANATQNTKVKNWFTPESIADVPDALEVKANDTSFCASHWPPTLTESLTYRLERYFWEPEAHITIPKFSEIGQDIKVFSLRQGKRVEITLCVPTISTLTKSHDDYNDIIRKYESKLQLIAEEISSPYNVEVTVRINPHQKLYMLGIGSCIECGEEGLVGRGNTISGVISSHRVHTQESWAGKNPVYHTGRVLGYLTLKLARSIGNELNVKCSVSAMTKCGDSLIPPRFLGISTDKVVSTKEVQKIVEKDFISANYLQEILSFRPWFLSL
jgi:S-adenosylmethionine synthetase